MSRFSRISSDDDDRESQDESSIEEVHDEEDMESDGIVRSHDTEVREDVDDTLNDADESQNEQEKPPKKQYQAYEPYKYFLTKEAACLAMCEEGDDEDDEEEDDGDDDDINDNDLVHKYKWKFRQRQGKTHWYECSHAGCKVRLKLIQDPPTREKGTWAIYSSSTDHDHTREQTAVKERGLSKQVKELVAEYEKDHLAPRRMIGKLRARKIQPPTIQQLSTYLITLRKANRKKASGSDETVWSLSDVQKFAEKNSVKPEEIERLDLDTVFVASFEYELKPKRKFRLFLTTKRLLTFVQRVSVNYSLYCCAQ